MNYKLELQNNNVDLQGLIDKANALPDAGTGETINLDAEITEQEEKLAAQETLISNMMTALDGKAAGGNVKTTKTIYLDWSQDEEHICSVHYISNNQIIDVYKWSGITEIEAEGGFVAISAPTTYFSANIHNFDNRVYYATQDGETIYFVSNSSGEDV